MSQEKTERQLNLVICLLATRRFLTAQEIRATVPGYSKAESDAAFKRMFERDKKELRDSGIPIEMGGGDVWSDEEGYRISRADYELAEIELRPDEAAVLGLAARAWRHAALGSEAANALMKLRAAGVPVHDDAAPSVAPVLATDEPAFLPVWQAVRDRRPIVFDYRKPDLEVTRREVEPWGVVNLRGRWYVAGHDRGRGARRVFRLGRIVGDVRVVTSGPPVEVPADADVRSMVRLQESGPDRVAVLRVRADAAHELRRRAHRILPGDHSVGEPGWDVLEYPYTDPAGLVADVAGYGARVEVVEPDEARAAIAAHLRAVAERDLGDVEAEAPAARELHAAAPRRAAASSEQLRRLLMLVPYALSHDVRVSEVAEHFGLSEKQVIKDLGLLWMCGLPGYTPGDLIDVDIEAAQQTGEIIIANADTLAKPLRLTADEAASLVIGVELLRDLLGELPGIADSDALKRVETKLREAAGAPVERLTEAVDVRLEISDEVRDVQRRADEALRGGHRVHLRYLSSYQDEVTEREVDPIRLLVQEGHPFLEGWCRLRQDVRLFRLDRVLDLTVLPVAAEVPEGVHGRDLEGGLLPPSPHDTFVTLDLSPAGRWVAEEYVCEGLRELDGGWLRATLRTPVPAWARRLALRLGPDARVVAPVEVAEQVREEAGKALGAYLP
ncbi:helix-turn-helix transcriptional regulator [Marinactinospora thermotolerans]|uniref:Transcriptional regulator n=1 Tax=Marinactinospora thermotolerans DSM 45154 TaxID=1122192 RepID=A0A1T4T5P6_9ACTN|nr:WYL domain-containing protein [Marinactinospora thermotolerans]SKA35727.1 transcriptional regulator [Marinactinospora thermotolerans DSM 45154]